jgi:hypothetical protein
MHIHDGPFQVVAVDGNTLQLSARYQADTVNVGPGQRYDVIWTARQPGKWLIHCHIGHHTTNNNAETSGGGGLMMVIDVAPRRYQPGKPFRDARNVIVDIPAISSTQQYISRWTFSVAER